MWKICFRRKVAIRSFSSLQDIMFRIFLVLGDKTLSSRIIIGSVRPSGSLTFELRKCIIVIAGIMRGKRLGKLKMALSRLANCWKHPNFQNFGKYVHFASIQFIWITSLNLEFPRFFYIRPPLLILTDFYLYHFQ